MTHLKDSNSNMATSSLLCCSHTQWSSARIPEVARPGLSRGSVFHSVSAFPHSSSSHLSQSTSRLAIPAASPPFLSTGLTFLVEVKRVYTRSPPPEGPLVTPGGEPACTPRRREIAAPGGPALFQPLPCPYRRAASLSSSAQTGFA